jgi:hypothetical protein
MQMITHNSFRRYFNTKPNKLKRRKANKLKIKQRRQLCLNLIKKKKMNLINCEGETAGPQKVGLKKFGNEKSNRLREMNEHKKSWSIISPSVI